MYIHINVLNFPNPVSIWYSQLISLQAGHISRALWSHAVNGYMRQCRSDMDDRDLFPSPFPIIYVNLGNFIAPICDSVFSFLFLKYFIYLFRRNTERERERERQSHIQREKQAPYREPVVGLDPRTLGSHHEPKADTQPLSHLGVPMFYGS